MRHILGPLVLVLSLPAHPQKLPPPTRDVYRCEAIGRVTYSDAPCLGAKKVDVEPTRGLNASSGQERVGPDVRRERQREQFAEAVRPIAGKDAKQLDTHAKRFKLPAAAQRECEDLDSAITAAEQQERLATAEALRSVQAKLLSLRQRSASLGC